MPQRMGQAKVRTETITQNGEVHLVITLDINLNMSSDGININVKNGTQTQEIAQEDKVEYPIPDFSSLNSGLSFGKKKNI